MGNNYVEQKSLVPVIHKNQFDAISTEFLTKYCLESLKASMIVPIADVAKKKMGLRIIAKYRLSEYFSIYGKICSTSRITPIYGQEDEYRDLEVRAGTILTDPYTLCERNIGCLHNTIAYECAHWYKHHNYHLYNSGIFHCLIVSYIFKLISTLICVIA